VIAPGISLGYRRTGGAGTWTVRLAERGKDWIKKIALADDYEDAAPPHSMTYWQAMDAARLLARGVSGTISDENAPLTVAQALDKYEADLRDRGGCVSNATRARCNAGSLLHRFVAQLTIDELKGWVRHLATTMAPASVNRTRSCLRAALELAAAADRRITNTATFKIGLKGIADAQRAENVILDQRTVLAFVAKAYEVSDDLGLLMDILAETGARTSQATRLEVGDFRDHATRPTLMIPRSAKGGSSKRLERKNKRIANPISTTLAARLRKATENRDPRAPLLLQNGMAWCSDPSTAYRRDVRAIFEALGVGHATVYALRHSSIVRNLLANVPVRVVAALHDTSVGQIESNYSHHIDEYSDEVARRGLLNRESNVVALVA
jgi:integrase